MGTTLGRYTAEPGVALQPASVAGSGTVASAATAGSGAASIACGRRVASAEPRTTSPSPTPIAGVNVSLRTSTPRKAATAGLTYVITVERTGPISATSAAKTRKAAAVHTTPRTTMEIRTLVEGWTAGHWTIAIGR